MKKREMAGEEVSSFKLQVSRLLWGAMWGAVTEPVAQVSAQKPGANLAHQATRPLVQPLLQGREATHRKNFAETELGYSTNKRNHVSKKLVTVLFLEADCTVVA